MTEPRPVPPRVLLALGVALVLLVAAVVGVRAVRGTPATDGVRSGLVLVTDTTSSESSSDDPHRLDFSLPVGRLQVAVGDPTQTLPAYDAPGIGEPGDDVHSGRDRRFVPVSWSLGSLDTGLTGTPFYGFRVVLVADGRRYDLRSDDRGFTGGDPPSRYDPGATRSVVAVVDGPVGADDLGVEVTYDGLTQHGDIGTGQVDAGPAAQLGSPTRYAPTRGCAYVVHGLPGAPDRAADLVPDPSCQVGLLAPVPHVAGLGWAPADHPWLVAHVSLRFPTELELPRGDVVLRRHPVAVPHDGRPPALRLTAYDEPAAYEATVVFDGTSTPHRLAVDARLTGERRGVRVTVSLPALPLRLVS